MLRAFLLALPLLGVGEPLRPSGAQAEAVDSLEVEEEAVSPPEAQGDFQALAGERARVLFRRAPDSTRARRILRFLEGLPPLRGLPDSFPRGVEIYIAPSKALFDSLAGGVVPEWGAAVAVPGLNRMVMPGFEARRSRGWEEARVLRHEWAHLALHQYLEGLRIPRWFDEGFAEWASGGWTGTQGWRLRVAFALGRAPPLDSLVLDWPRDRASAGLAYLLSATAVEYLVQESGVRGLEVLLERWRQGAGFSRALRTVYGVTTAQFEEDWKKYVRRRYGWLFVLSHSSVFWLALALALLLMVRIRRGRNREAMARLRATEPPDEPAYWHRDSEEGGSREKGQPGDGPEKGE
jgi:hypothetical protein